MCLPQHDYGICTWKRSAQELNSVLHLYSVQHVLSSARFLCGGYVSKLFCCIAQGTLRDTLASTVVIKLTRLLQCCVTVHMYTIIVTLVSSGFPGIVRGKPAWQWLQQHTACVVAACCQPCCMYCMRGVLAEVHCRITSPRIINCIAWCKPLHFAATVHYPHGPVLCPCGPMYTCVSVPPYKLYTTHSALDVTKGLPAYLCPLTQCIHAQHNEVNTSEHGSTPRKAAIR
jgi:hypothetical protein